MKVRSAAPAAFLAGALLVPLLFASPVRASGPDGKVSFGGDLRLRGEGLANALDLDDDADDSYSYYRMRYRIWTDARPRDDIALHFRFGSEYHWGRGIRTNGVRDPDSKVSLDNGWAELRLAAGPQIGLKFGRMDLQYGEGFLVLEGTPADGSASQWFDAIVATLRQDRLAVDLLTAKLDEEGFGTEERDEDLYGIHASSAPLEGYVFHRTERKAFTFPNGTPHPKQRTTVAGARYAKTPDSGPHVVAEGGYQIGRFADNDRRAFGGYARTGWTFPSKERPGFEFGGLYLSGDDPETKDMEGWDPFYSEWPKYSELLLYTFLDFTTRLERNEPGTWTDLIDLWAEGRWIQTDRTRITSRLSLLWEAEAPRMGGDVDHEDGDSYLGLLAAFVLNHAPNPNVSTQLLGEFFSPADRLQADEALYGRWQITVKF